MSINLVGSSLGRKMMRLGGGLRRAAQSGGEVVSDLSARGGKPIIPTLKSAPGRVVGGFQEGSKLPRAALNPIDNAAIGGAATGLGVGAVGGAALAGQRKKQAESVLRKLSSLEEAVEGYGLGRRVGNVARLGQLGSTALGLAGATLAPKKDKEKESSSVTAGLGALGAAFKNPAWRRDIGMGALSGAGIGGLSAATVKPTEDSSRKSQALRGAMTGAAYGGLLGAVNKGLAEQLGDKWKSYKPVQRGGQIGLLMNRGLEAAGHDQQDRRLIRQEEELLGKSASTTALDFPLKRTGLPLNPTDKAMLIAGAGGALGGAALAPSDKRLEGASAGLEGSLGLLTAGTMASTFDPGSLRMLLPNSVMRQFDRWRSVPAKKKALGLLAGSALGGTLYGAMKPRQNQKMLEEEERSFQEEMEDSLSDRTKTSGLEKLVAPGVGAALGGITGAEADDENRLRGGLVGAGLGAAGGALAEKVLRERARGADPFAHIFSLARKNRVPWVQTFRSMS